MFRVAFSLALLAGCGAHRSYHPRSLHAEREVERRAIRAIGDVQVACALRFIGSHDAAPLLTLWLRNAGVESVAIDVSRLRVRGHAKSGVRALQLSDPRGELEPLHIDPGAFGREKIRLSDLASAAGSLEKICVDVASMFDGAPVAPVCFAPGPDAPWVVVE